MRAYSASSEEALYDGDLLKDWAGEGFLTKAQYEHMQQETANVVLPAEPEVLAEHLRARAAEGVRMNVNFLGEALQQFDELWCKGSELGGVEDQHSRRLVAVEQRQNRS